ncbi:MAG: outer membrane beta-barrel protein [Bacteroidetes bacterium]|uniref:Outer membrane beta-barrel protein n=1 Tax=Candidatus Enterocola intestinipullorum TaxID=2840783 RepID=A0A9D9EFE2_9BACT|nr:outer membrane beta-barrel protein [Candidatus Enterocola intestinipullorum]
MKKLILAAAFMMVSVAGFAQASLGIKAGYKTSLGLDQNWQSVQGLGESFRKDVSQGFNVGLMSRFGYRVYAQIEALYSYQKTAYNALDGGNVIAGETFEEHSLEVPVMFGAKLVETRNFNLRLMVGPTFCFNLGDTPADFASWDFNKRTVSFGLDCGIGVDIWVFAIDLRYKLLQQSYDYTFNSQALNTSPINAFEVSLGWKFFDTTKGRR